MKRFVSLLICAFVLFPLIPASVSAQDDSLILYYSFDGTIPSDVEVYNVSYSPEEEAVAGKAAFFDGNSSYLKLPQSVNKSLDGNYTISAWVKAESPNWWMRIFDFGSDNTSYAFLSVYSTTDARFAMLTENTGGEITMTASNAIGDGVWVNLTLVRDNKTMKLYKNGILAVSSDAFGENTPADIDNAQNYIGKSQFNDPYFHGCIDEFKIYRKALDENEIVSSMADGIKTQYASYIADASGVYDGLTARESLALRSFEGENASLSWSSSDESAISPGGAVTRGETDKTVTLTASVTLGGETRDFSYSVFVPSVSSFNAEIYADASQKGADINPDMIGLFFEDVNYSADGGLYAELVQNRSFEAVDARANVSSPAKIPSYAWTVEAKSSSFLSEEPLNENNTTYLRISNPSALDKISNNCYGGFPAEKGEKFDFSVFLRSGEDFSGNIMVSLAENGTVVGRTYISDLSGEWTKHEAEITAASDAENAVLEITFLGAFPQGSFVDFDMISLFPQNTWMNRKNGLRRDLVQMLKDMHPGFLRFPGGCIVEGYNLSNRYSWKDTVGSIEERKENWNRWQMHTSGDGRYGYCQTYGLGFYEYFLLCEDIGAEPLPVLNVGIGCQYQQGDVSSMEELYQIYIPDALDLIEFANGDPDENEWAALRAGMGHPEPFNLKYIGIGNEQWESSSVNFYERYEAFEKAIHEKYPEMRLIATSGPSDSGSAFDSAQSWLKTHSENGEESFAEAVDEHYYKTPAWFYANLNRYDVYDREGYGVFIGEYASRYHQSASESNMEAALSIAAFMTSLEKNSDVVKFASYAPLFAREGYAQWYPDLIGFDEAGVFGTPDYYVQSMYSNNLGTYTLESTTKNSDLYYTPHGKTGLGTWETSVIYSDYRIWDDEQNREIALEELGEPSGVWDGLTQLSSLQGAYKFLAAPSSASYTISFKATKLSGSEGFLIPLLWEDENNHYAWNVGGWGNTYSAIQRTENGATTEASVKNTAVTVEEGREYEITIKISPEKIACYLDGQCVNFVSFRQNVYSSSSFDETTGDIIVKAVNTASSPMETLFNISSAKINPTADVVQLKTDNIYSVNSIEEPMLVSPGSFETPVSESFVYSLPANSFTVFRLHTKPDGEIAASAKDVEVTLTKGDILTLPDNATVTFKDGSTKQLPVKWDAVPQEFTSVTGTTAIEGTVTGTNLYAHALVTILPSERAAEITLAGQSVIFDAASFAGENTRAILAFYNEDGTLTQSRTALLTPDSPAVEIDLSPFSAASQIKAFLFDGLNPLADSVKVK